MTDPRAAQIIDKLICLQYYDAHPNEIQEAVSEGLAYLMETGRDHPAFEASVWRKMAAEGIVT